HVYERPSNQFVAGFIGSPAMNMVGATLSRENGHLAVGFGEHRLTVDDALVDSRPALRDYVGRTLILGIRPENIEDAAFAPDTPPDRRLATVCSLREALGSDVLVHFPVAAEAPVTGPLSDEDPVEPLEDWSSVFVARIDPGTRASEGKALELAVDTSRLHFFDPKTGLAI